MMIIQKIDIVNAFSTRAGDGLNWGIRSFILLVLPVLCPAPLRVSSFKEREVASRKG